MSKLPPLKRIAREDFPQDVQQWIDKLISPLNEFMTSVSNALAAKLTLADNCVAQFRTVNVTKSGGVLQSAPLRLRCDIGKPKAVLTVQAVASNGHGVGFSLPGWDWDGSSQVVIRELPTLADGAYSVTFLFVGG